MENPDTLKEQQQIALKLGQDLAVLRDAVTRLSLALQDYVYESSGKNDPATAFEAQNLIAKAKL